MNEVGERIAILRKKLNLNQTEFGNKLNLKQTTIAGYENGHRSVQERIVKDICRVFDVSYAWITAGDGGIFSNNDAYLKDKIDIIMEGENEFHKRLVKETLNLSDDELQVIYKLVMRIAKEKDD